MRSAANRARLSPLIIEDDFGRYWAALAPSHVGPFVTALTAADVLDQATARLRLRDRNASEASVVKGPA